MADKKILEEEFVYLTALINNHKKNEYKAAPKYSNTISKRSASFNKGPTNFKANYTWKRGSRGPGSHVKSSVGQNNSSHSIVLKPKQSSTLTKPSDSIVTMAINPLPDSNSATRSQQHVAKNQKCKVARLTKNVSPVKYGEKYQNLTSTPIVKQNRMPPLTLNTPCATKMRTTVKSKYKIEKQVDRTAISPIVAIPTVTTVNHKQQQLSSGFKTNTPYPSPTRVTGKQHRTWYNPLQMKSGKSTGAAKSNSSSLIVQKRKLQDTTKKDSQGKIQINHKKRASPFIYKNQAKITRYSIQRGSAVQAGHRLNRSFVNRHHLFKLNKSSSRTPERKSQRLARSVSSTGQRAMGHNQGVTKNKLLKKTRTKIIRGTRKEEITNVSGQRFVVSHNGKALKRVRSSEGTKKRHHLLKSSSSTTSIPASLSRSRLLSTPPLPHSKKITREFARRAIHRSIYRATQAKYKKRNSQASDYCMFYNRFGRCNHGDQCPYIHDPDKVAVCTRFLKGTCRSDGSCPFSHVVNKDKMPVCSYFLRGVCNRDDCPYSHVKVSHTAAVCQDFLKGYCPLGKKCTKKHTLECPEFSQKGKCPHGEKCKLKHSSQRVRGNLVKRSRGHGTGRLILTGQVTHDKREKSATSSNEDDLDGDSGSEGTTKEAKSTESHHLQRLPSYISLAKYSESPEEDSGNTSGQNEEELMQIPRFISLSDSDKY